jgi:hypothetical protein
MHAIANPVVFSPFLEFVLVSTTADDYQLGINVRLACCKRIDEHIRRFVKLSKRTYENDTRFTILPCSARSGYESTFR